MRSREQGRFPDGAAGVAEAERILRQIAQAPVPEGLEERVKAALRAAPATGKVLVWRRLTAPGFSGTMQVMLRGAAAAAIVLVVAGGGWGIFSHVQPARPTAQSLPRLAAPGGFSSAGAMRTPQTLAAPKVHAGAAKNTGNEVVTQPDAAGARASQGTRQAHTHKPVHKSAAAPLKSREK